MSIERKTKILWIRNPKEQDFHFTDSASAEQQSREPKAWKNK
jgi:hypothetical protein